MKNNGNDTRTGEYYLGLDVGTNSVGWAVTDRQYDLLKHKGNAMWGVRLFDEAQDASTRRSSRTARRRLARRNQRLKILELLFDEEIRKIDPLFFQRLADSAYWLDDKTDKTCHFSLFNDLAFTDKDYHRKYPTIYHLRYELMRSDKPHDVRLVFLALHHIIKSRGHFLYESVSADDSIPTVADEIGLLNEYLSAEYGTELKLNDATAFEDALSRRDLGVRAKQKLLHAAWAGAEDEEQGVSLSGLVDMLSGAKTDLAKLFCDESLSGNDIGNISLNSDLEAQYDALSSLLGDRAELILKLKDVYDASVLCQMLQGHNTLSAAKIALYDKNHADLRALKKYVRAVMPEKYKESFSEKKAGLNNYAAYSGYLNRSGSHSCTQEDFCKYLRSTLNLSDASDPEMKRIFQEIKDGVFLPKLKGTDNGVIPYQLQRIELRAILERASAYLPFLNEKDEDGNSVRDKIEKTFEFRIPYYVGPLNSKSPSAWAVRFPGKESARIYPWNMETIIDTEASSARFIENLIGRCTYTGEYVLPKDSILYSEYMLLNELNPLQVNGRPIPVEAKQAIVRDLFEASRKPVTKKKIKDYLVCQGYISSEDELSGIDDRVKTVLKSYHDFRRILDKTGDRELVEEIIRRILIFGNDRKMLKKWLRKNAKALNEDDYSYICRLSYREWGRLSKTFLTEIYGVDKQEQTGEAHTIIEMLCSTNLNLMQLLSDRYSFAESAEAYRQERYGYGKGLTERLEEMYIAPAVRRSIRQTLKIVDEIVDIRKAVPEKIFIEMARDSAKEMKGKRTESRKAKLLALYASCREQSAELLPKLEQEDDSRLRSDKLFLYYTQFGKCMYSGEPIDLDELMNGRGFDIDHIFPQSRIKDNSLDNRVVVKNTLNRDKSNIYPLDQEIRHRMKPYWDMLLNAGMISRKKYDRLVRSAPLSETELASFVARQLVETQQSTKALTVLLKERYGDKTRIVFSKAGNVSDFRHTFDLIKCREVNDLHHAKDAYLNVVVGNVYCTRFTDAFFKNIMSENYSLKRVFEFDVPRAWDKTETIKTVKKVMAKNNPIITRMPRQVKGQLFDLQPVSRTEAIISRKQFLPADRYGGYTGRYAAFFIVVEHSKGKNRIRTIEPVYLYAKQLYDLQPLEYCRKELGLADPTIVVSMLRVDSLVELDGIKLYLTGGSNSHGDGRDVYDLSSQLIMDYDRELLVKAILKYLDRAEARKEESSPTVYDGIDDSKLIDLYDWFENKLEAAVYRELFSQEKKVLETSREQFKQLSPVAKCRVLKQILLMLQSNAVIPNFTELCGKKIGKRIRKNCKLSGLISAYIIHQSPTGLYEVRENLLR